MSDLSSDDQMNPVVGISNEYEKNRERTIAQNKARMEALGLKRLANSLMTIFNKKIYKDEVKKSKQDEHNTDDDDVCYEPNTDEDDDDDFVSDGGSDDRVYI